MSEIYIEVGKDEEKEEIDGSRVIGYTQDYLPITEDGRQWYWVGESWNDEEPTHDGHWEEYISPDWIDNDPKEI